jgi:hypothetical protein
MADQQQLRELHDEYVWEVNAAVGEDRLDLVDHLTDDYLDRALRLLSAGEPPTCGSPDCAVCSRPRELPGPRSRPAHRSWWRRRLR